jgi:hypothetical protein
MMLGCSAKPFDVAKALWRKPRSPGKRTSSPGLLGLDEWQSVLT